MPGGHEAVIYYCELNLVRFRNYHDVERLEIAE